MLETRRHRYSRAKRKSHFTFERLEHRLVLSGPGEGGIDEPNPLDLTRFESTEELEKYLIDDAIDKWDGLFGQPTWGYPPWPVPFLELDLATPLLRTAAEGATFAAPDHSDTNTQVVGVDEADLVETDGNYLYILSGQEVVIADAWPHDELSVTSRVEIDGQPLGQYLNGDRLTVISRTFDYFGIPEPWLGGPVRSTIDIAFPVPAQATVKVTVLDVSDRSSPTIVQETEIDGSYVDSRAIGEFVYIVSSESFGLPAPEVICETTHDGGKIGEPVGARLADPGFAPIDIDFIRPDSTCFYETREAYLERVEGQVLELGLPHYASFDSTGQLTESGLLSEATDIYKPILADDSNLISVVVFDVTSNDPGPTFSTSVPTTYSTQVYGSTDNLYLVNPDWGRGWNRSQATSILKFDLDQETGVVDLTAVGEVPGRILNSFSIDEYVDAERNEFLRIATSQGWGRETDNRVFVLQESEDSLDIVGRTESLARGEQIYSVRFMEETAYVVTFLRVDPLFTLDLSDPHKPHVVGELKIPGFSNYLHPVQDGFLLGIGNDADEKTGRVTGLQVSLIDVTDQSNPLLADRFTFDLPGWASTEAASDHHAVSYFPEYQVLAIPVNNGSGWDFIDRDGDGIGDVQIYRPRTDLWVFHIDLPNEADPTKKGDIQFLGRIEHDSQVRRSVRIEDSLYSISDSSVKVHEILNPENLLANLHFGQDGVGVPVFHMSPDDPIASAAVQTPERSAPQVIDVAVGSTSWDRDFVNYLDAEESGSDGSPPMEVLPFSNIDQIKVTFSEDVIVGWNDVSVRGVNRSEYPITNFSYDAETSTAIWTLDRAAEADTLTVEIKDGVQDLAGNALDGNSNGRAGGTFTHQFNVLTGDVNEDGRVNRTDMVIAMSHPVSHSGDPSYALSRDVDGSGTVDDRDFRVIGERTGTALPGVEPSLGIDLFPGDANGDMVFNQRDIIQVLQRGKYLSGEPADWIDGDWNQDGVFDQYDVIAALKEGHYTAAGMTKPEEAAVDILFEDEPGVEIKL